jgi:TonB family protein
MDARTESRTYSFMALSTVGHVVLAIGIMTLKLQLPEPKEITQIELISAPAPAPALAAMQIPTRVAEAPAHSVAPKAAVTETKVQSTPVASPIEPVAAELPQMDEELSAPVLQTLPSHPKTSTPKTTARAMPKPIPAVLPVVENTDLETPVAQGQTELKDEDIAEDLLKVDREENRKLVAVHEDLSQAADQELKEQEAKLAAMQKQNTALSQKMARENALKRSQEKQALAIASAKAAAEAKEAAKAQAAQLAAERAHQAAAAKQAHEAAIAAAAAKLAMRPTQDGDAPGDGNQVRSLEELKQMPGNERPQYDAQDRLHQRQGEVAFLAYVSRDGSIVNYKMLKSSGHRELDSKTLKAIRGWKFYPGQEGWVEIPFKWDLKGGPQEMPTTLRRRTQANQNEP